ncbi:hypothetical protein UFOVP801_9 [uncultured Caudovirales phage]|uniref:Transglycosylase SLT domain-containing protein n=1 Tax=uncultured Caudovirales phage TaxID=2100421 RepID=A0A6J5P1L9_9CAUD|nr:hypothetical protein UFOVP801_9 [uncultured Caudovirales phage]
MSYPQSYPQAGVDKATHRPQSLTDCQDPSLYLKDNLLKIKINKKKINIKYLATSVSIIILTISSTYQAKAATQADLLKLYAHSRLVSMEQFSCFEALIKKESNWRVEARNGSHYGLGQMRNAKYGRLDGFSQVDWSLRYIKSRYGSMCNAWRFFKKHNYH